MLGSCGALTLLLVFPESLLFCVGYTRWSIRGGAARQLLESTALGAMQDSAEADGVAEWSNDALTDVQNALGGGLERCSIDPLTGWYRDGYCRTDESDLGRHLVCVQTTEQFLSHQRSIGNDLSTPAPRYQFPGLKPGDSWCVCASRWAEAVVAGVVAPIRLRATHTKALDFVPEETLLRLATDAA
eukprot:CAMPEP_0171095386 /NCGR_PEP_ID=MMETSP0766_2-20121228/43142_1 /TAXON_ID=439317 /ORGANISM="Gambierdiscus australes, Strain CAWD 149" /LENGTH=185 /DNA_ID=CAMNT_0011554185 /DNA_START=159 /DNA_END=716 /DNA_ORIENTATION=-